MICPGTSTTDEQTCCVPLACGDAKAQRRTRDVATSTGAYPGDGNAMHIVHGDGATDAGGESVDITADVDTDATEGDATQILFSDGVDTTDGDAAKIARIGPDQAKGGAIDFSIRISPCLPQRHVDTRHTLHAVVDEVDPNSCDATRVAQTESNALHCQVDGTRPGRRSCRQDGEDKGLVENTSTVHDSTHSLWQIGEKPQGLYNSSCTISCKVSLLSCRASSR